ncbi:MAG: ribosomal L7Ae/L30e/S12e/Gadd45 family protein [Clostridia bacterium]|nr:ribosomal L7Ae/L30e/S12e/Gadd45 family protein [Clostridia bacterium]
MDGYLSKKNIVIGVRQSLQALIDGNVIKLYYAMDAERHIIEEALSLARQKNISIVEVETMMQLGSFCDIKVKAAIAAEIM